MLIESKRTRGKGGAEGFADVDARGWAVEIDDNINFGL